MHSPPPSTNRPQPHESLPAPAEQAAGDMAANCVSWRAEFAACAAVRPRMHGASPLTLCRRLVAQRRPLLAARHPAQRRLVVAARIWAQPCPGRRRTQAIGWSSYALPRLAQSLVPIDAASLQVESSEPRLVPPLAELADLVQERTDDRQPAQEKDKLAHGRER